MSNEQQVKGRFERMKVVSDTVAAVQRSAFLILAGVLMLKLVPSPAPAEPIPVTVARYLFNAAAGAAILGGYVLLALVSLYISAIARRFRRERSEGYARFFVMPATLLFLAAVNLVFAAISFHVIGDEYSFYFEKFFGKPRWASP